MKMKRGSDRDSSPLRKRSRSSISRYDDSSDDGRSPEPDRRDRGRSPGPSPSRGRYPPDPYRDDHRSRFSDKAGYKVLCVSGIHPKASDETVRDALYREFKRFGEVNVKVVHEPDERVAYIYFRSSEDAREAKHNKPRILFYEKPVYIESVSDGGSGSGDYRRRRSISPDYPLDRYSRPRSPGPFRHRIEPDDRYDRGYPPPPGPPRDYRRDLPPPHDYPPPPPPHHGPRGPPPSRHYGPPRHGPQDHYRPHYMKHENKKDKFPNYLHHIPPEEDPLATRTLFAGNLEINISEDELRKIFGRYGVVEDIDIKRPPPGTGNAYAFVRFQNLDMAHRAKVELSGQYIGKFQCKIGFGKATPTTRVWVGGLGPWTSLSQLEREFDRFGAIKNIDWVKGEPHAYILYDSIDAAKTAVEQMRGFPLGGQDKRLRADFADVDSYTFKSGQFGEDGPTDSYRIGNSASGSGGGGSTGGGPSRDDYSQWGDPPYENFEGFDNYTPSRGNYRGRGRGGAFRGNSRSDSHGDGDWSRKRDSEYEGTSPKAYRGRLSRTPEPGEANSRSVSPNERRHSGDSDSGSDHSKSRNGVIEGARSVPELARRSVSVWQGGLVLKNSLFPTKFHLAEGDIEIVDSLLKDEEGRPLLRITQRLRLDPPKLEDVSKRMVSSGSHAVFLSMPCSSSGVEDNSVQQRPLRNLVSYLKQKEAAGVISLQNKDSDLQGVLYAFPPCQFSTELLKRTAPGLPDEIKEDHLVVVVVKGGSG